MFCEYCGAKIEEGDAFCPECGRKVEGAPAMIRSNVPEAEDVQEMAEEVSQEAFESIPDPGPAPGYVPPVTPAAPPVRDEPKKETPLKKILIFAGIGVAVIALAIAAFTIVKKLGSSSKIAKQSVFYVDDIYVSPNADAQAVELLSDEDSYVDTNATGSAALIENDDLLYFFDGKNITEIMEVKDVDDYIFLGLSSRFALTDTDGTLFVYDEKGKATQIGEEGEFKKNQINSLVGSADGKYLGYSVLSSGSVNVQGYVYDGKKVVELGKNNLPGVISSDGKLLYYIDNNTKTGKRSFIVRKGLNSDKETELISDISNSSDPFVNADAKELIYYSDGKSYITVNGKEPSKLVSEVVYPILPYGVRRCRTQDASILVYDVASFKNSFFAGDEAVYYMDGKYEMTKVAKHVNTEYCYVASDGKTLIYQDDEHNIYRLNGKKNGADPEKLVDEDAYGFVPTADGKTFFFINEDEELMAQKGSGKAVTVSDEPDSTYLDRSMLFKGKTLYFTEDDELYFSNGGKAEAVKSLNQDVYSYRCTNDYITVDAEEEFLYSKDGKKFSPLLEK